MSLIEAKVKAVKNILYCLHDRPFKAECAGVYYNMDAMARAIVHAVEQEERVAEFAE